MLILGPEVHLLFSVVYHMAMYLMNFPNFLQDVMKYVSEMPNQFRLYEVPYPTWNHLDYMWAIDGDKYIYPEILKDIKAFQQKFLK